MSETNELRQAAQKALKAMSYYPVTVNHWKLVLLPAAEALRAALEKKDEPMPCHYLNEPGNVCNKCGEIHSGESRTYKRFRVYVAQVNAAVIEVEARDEDEARAMAASKWRSDYAIPRVKAAEEAAPTSAASPAA